MKLSNPFVIPGRKGAECVCDRVTETERLCVIVRKGALTMKCALALAAAALMACGGCSSSRMTTADGRRVENISLRAMAHNTRSPEIGKIYVHKGGRTMRVIQSLEKGVLVRPVVGEMELEWRGMTIYIETPEVYVDDEFLKAGFYEYVGRYTYTAVHDVRATVRRFREVKAAGQ